MASGLSLPVTTGYHLPQQTGYLTSLNLTYSLFSRLQNGRQSEFISSHVAVRIKNILSKPASIKHSTILLYNCLLVSFFPPLDSSVDTAVPSSITTTSHEAHNQGLYPLKLIEQSYVTQCSKTKTGCIGLSSLL